MSKILSKIQKYTKNPLKVSNVLTIVLIIVTIVSTVATIQITKVSLAIDKQKQKDVIISQIAYVEKLIIEIQSDKGILEYYASQLNSFKNSAEFYPIEGISIERTQNAADFIDNRQIIAELDTYSSLLGMIKRNFANLEANSLIGDLRGKNISIDIAQQNMNVALNGGKDINGNIVLGLKDIISKLRLYELDLEKALMKLN